MVEIVCEAALTHLGNIDTAFRLADTAYQAGADAIKFQTYLPDKLLRKGDPDRLELEKLALSFDDTKKLAKHCEDIKIEFMSTPGELDSLKFIVEECGVKRIKIGSDDITNKKLVDAAYMTGKPVILSTGMATFEEINKALPHDGGYVSITLMHCVSLYPTPPEKANLRRLKALGCFPYPLGYSDHTQTFMASYLAMALGAEIIEKHICPNAYNGPDKEVSLNPVELRLFVEGIRAHEKLLGMTKIEPSYEETLNIPKFRKGKDGFRGYI